MTGQRSSPSIKYVSSKTSRTPSTQSGSGSGIRGKGKQRSGRRTRSHGQVCYPRSVMNNEIPTFPEISYRKFLKWQEQRGFKPHEIKNIIGKRKRAEGLATRKGTDFHAEQEGSFKIVIPIPNEPRNILKITKVKDMRKMTKTVQRRLEVMRMAQTEYKIQNFLSRQNKSKFVRERVPSIKTIFFSNLWEYTRKGESGWWNLWNTKTIREEGRTWFTIERNLYKENEQVELADIIDKYAKKITFADVQAIYNEGLNFLFDMHHKLHIAHRDIKPENLFYNMITKKLFFFDFGFGCTKENKCDNYIETCSGFVGSLLYVPYPMRTSKNRYNFSFEDFKAQDLYSMIIVVLSVYQYVLYPKLYLLILAQSGDYYKLSPTIKAIEKHLSNAPANEQTLLNDCIIHLKFISKHKF